MPSPRLGDVLPLVTFPAPVDSVTSDRRARATMRPATRPRVLGRVFAQRSSSAPWRRLAPSCSRLLGGRCTVWHQHEPHPLLKVGMLLKASSSSAMKAAIVAISLEVMPWQHPNGRVRQVPASPRVRHAGLDGTLVGVVSICLRHRLRRGSLDAVGRPHLLSISSLRCGWWTRLLAPS